MKRRQFLLTTGAVALSTWRIPVLGATNQAAPVPKFRVRTLTHRPKHVRSFLVTLAWLVLLTGSVPPATGNWPQFMRDSAHTGDAADEALRLPLELVAQVRLDDAVMTSSAVVGGLAYVVDQMGTAYCIEAKTGEVLWRSTDPFGSTYPVLAGDRLLLNEYFGDLSCVSAADGKLLWKRKTSGYSRFSVGPGFLVMRGYGGHGAKVRLEDGKDYPDCRELGGDLHACGAVALTAEYSFAITLGGLNVREVRTGKLLWESPGFAPRACVNPVLGNGRIFWTSAASGMIYCFEPCD